MDSQSSSLERGFFIGCGGADVGIVPDLVVDSNSENSLRIVTLLHFEHVHQNVPKGAELPLIKTPLHTGPP